MNDSFSNLFKDALAAREVNPSKGHDFLVNVRNRGYIVGTVSDEGVVSFSANPVVHVNKVAAQAEAARLSEQNPGKAFIFVQLAGGYLVPKLVGRYEF